MLLRAGLVVVLAGMLSAGGPESYLRQDEVFETKVILPGLAPQGEEFTGMILERKKDDFVPASGGTVTLASKSFKVNPDGTFTVPAFRRETGNFQLEGTFANDNRTSALRVHVEIVKSRPNLPCKIAESSSIVSGMVPCRVRGTGLNNLKEAELRSTGGASYDLPKSCGSSLEKIYLPEKPGKLPPANYRFTAKDDKNRVVKSPNESVCPRVRVDGSEIKYRGDRGEFTLNTSADTWIRLEGGDGMITLDTRSAYTTVANPAKIGFRADGVGLYAMRAVPIPAEERDIDPKAPKTDCDCGKPSCTQDAEKGTTQIETPVAVTDPSGKPLANADVQVAVAHPGGVEYTTCHTDGGGKATAMVNVVGLVSAGDVMAHPYRIPGYDWNKPGEETIPIDDGGGGVPEEPLHHCQGARMIILIGPDSDPTIHAAQQQVRSKPGVVHKLWIEVPTTDRPLMNKAHVSNAAGDAWTAEQDISAIVATFNDACYWDEILIMSHGSQSGLWDRLIEKLPILLDNRPVRRVTFGVCEASATVYPNNGNNSRIFEKVAYIIRPRNCPCNCSPAHCRARNSDGVWVKCPTRADSVKMYMSGMVPIAGRTDGFGNPTRIGLETSPLGLTSGDGRMLETTITDTQAGAAMGPVGQTSKASPDPNITTSSAMTGANPEVFSGITIGVRADLTDKREAKDTSKRTAGSVGYKPRELTERYTGPDANKNCKHENKEGCLAGGA